jgi:outer membrane protein assembly factor BamB
MRRLALLAAAATLLLAPAAAPAHHSHPQSPFPKLIALPDGWQPEGIAIKRSTFYVGSIPTGAVYRGDVRTGQGAPLVPAHEGRAAIGLKVHHKQLWVAGGPTGKAFVYDARTGADVAEFALPTTGTPFINDVAIGPREAYFTNSRAAEVFAVPLQGGPVRRIAITGDFVQTGAATDTNLNGIAVAGRHTLILVQSNTGRLFAADARTGVARAIDLGGADVMNGDGLLLLGRTLFVVQNRQNKIVAIKLSRDLARGAIVRTITDPAFDVPTTIAATRKHLYAVNARFGTTDPQPAKYNVVRVP